MTFAVNISDAEAATLRLCLPTEEHMVYCTTRTEYHRAVDKYGVNDNILHQIQLNTLWSEMSWVSKARALLARDYSRNRSSALLICRGIHRTPTHAV